MEEAYAELYREFIRLRSLCIKQAAMLQKLTEAQHSHKGVSAPIYSLKDMESIPVQCKQASAGLPISVGTKSPRTTEQKPDANHAVAPSSCVATALEYPPNDMGGLNLQIMNLSVEEREMKKAPTLLTLEPPGFNGALTFSKVFRNPGEVDPLSGDEEKLQLIPRTCESFLTSGFQSQVGGMLMSELALQSQVCEFCQAIFPGQTTTRDEFLQHLHTHIT